MSDGQVGRAEGKFRVDGARSREIAEEGEIWEAGQWEDGR